MLAGLSIMYESKCQLAYQLHKTWLNIGWAVWDDNERWGGTNNNNNYYTLLYIHYFVMLTRIGIENPIINHKSVLSSSTPADKLSQAELPGTLEWLIKLHLT